MWEENLLHSFSLFAEGVDVNKWMLTVYDIKFIQQLANDNGIYTSDNVKWDPTVVN
jgi:hypothetical protein